jgi:glucan biosynthesis protein C
MNNKYRLSFFSNLAKGKRVYLLMLPSVILYVLLEMQYPETNDLVHDGCYFFYWLFFLLAGFICINFPALMDSLERNRQTSLTFAVITIIAINYFRWNKLEPHNVFADYQHDVRTYLYIALYALTAWFWVFTAVGYGKRYLNKQHHVLSYVNQAVYPFYILHQTMIVILVYYVVQTNDTILMKYLFTVVVAFLLTMGIYHVLVRPFRVMRFLFGMKPKKEVKKIEVRERITTEELAVV